MYCYTWLSLIKLHMQKQRKTELGVLGGSNGDQVKCLILCHVGLGGMWEMAVKPSRGNAGEGFKGTESVFISFFYCFIMFFSPRWQPVDFPVLQAFFPLKTDRRESMRRPVTANFSNFNEFRCSGLWRGLLIQGHVWHTNSETKK